MDICAQDKHLCVISAPFALNDTCRLPRAAPGIKLRHMAVADRISAILTDARVVHNDAMRLLVSGDIRDAAEKAWCATKRATDALPLARTGEEPETSSDTSGGLLALAAGDDAVKPLIRRYYSRQSQLHGTCFYLGLCEPAEEVERRIRQTVDYIQDAENLAGVN